MEYELEDIEYLLNMYLDNPKIKKTYKKLFKSEVADIFECISSDFAEEIMLYNLKNRKPLSDFEIQMRVKGWAVTMMNKLDDLFGYTEKRKIENNTTI